MSDSARTAFPIIKDSKTSTVESGLTKIEYFTAMAMQGFLACNNPGMTFDAIAQSSVYVAEKTLKKLSEIS